MVREAPRFCRAEPFSYQGDREGIVALLLDDNMATSHEFSAPQQFYFLLGGYAGGVWVAEMQTPDGEWVVLNDTDYNRSGAWVAPPFPGFRMRFSGGTVGAKLWAEGVEIIG